MRRVPRVTFAYDESLDRGLRIGEILAQDPPSDEPIPEARRRAIPGVRLCIECQSGRDRSFRPAGGINRRGSKDSQLK